MACRPARKVGCLSFVRLCLPERVLVAPAPQALVEHLASGGGEAGGPSGWQGPQRVERCVLHFDITALDLDQVGGRLDGWALGWLGCRVSSQSDTSAPPTARSMASWP
jgi:hypothetical protein